eukprot:1159911-Pelagomonas_calceolata.AAC.17
MLLHWVPATGVIGYAHRALLVMSLKWASDVRLAAAYNTPGRLLRRQILMLLRMLLCLYRQQGSSFNSMVTEVPQNHRAGSKTMLLTPNGVAGCCYPRPCMTWPQ